jgi:hypothetical protein
MFSNRIAVAACDRAVQMIFGCQTRGVNDGLRSGRGRHSGALEHAGPHFPNIEQHRNHSDSHRVALNRPLGRGTQQGRPGRDVQQVLDHEVDQVLASSFLPRRQS